MIINNEILSMVESTEYIKKIADEETKTNIMGFIKKFDGLKLQEAKELRKKIIELNMMKIKKEHISKIIDLMPEDNIDLNKIFVDVNLEEDETKKILDVVKEFK